MLALRSFFALLFQGALPPEIVSELKLDRKPAAPPPAAAEPALQPDHGALEILSILQRDSRLIDFLMEDISGASDDQIRRGRSRSSRAMQDCALALRPAGSDH